jgi:phage tail-like protein
MKDFTINSAKFTVNIDGIDMSNCSSVSGFDMGIEKLIDDNGAQPVRSYKKGRSYVDDVEFTRILSSTKVYDWFKECQLGKITKRSASIICYDDKGGEVMRFNLEGCWPILWRGPSFQASQGSQMAYESFVLAVEAIELTPS